MCCGVSDYQRTARFNPRSGCESANNEDYFFSSENEGCKDKLVMLFEKYTPIVAGVAAGVALVMNGYYKNEFDSNS
ncbi:hypothetical protein Avbf_15820 [Armadillidium vulgare]|nr:hypothetical protein Avbf_15820 [Armadillidium vulgare]